MKWWKQSISTDLGSFLFLLLDQVLYQFILVQILAYECKRLGVDVPVGQSWLKDTTEVWHRVGLDLSEGLLPSLEKKEEGEVDAPLLSLAQCAAAVTRAISLSLSHTHLDVISIILHMS